MMSRKEFCFADCMGIGKLEESCIMESSYFHFSFVLKEFSILGKDFKLAFIVVRKYLYSLLVFNKVFRCSLSYF